MGILANRFTIGIQKANFVIHRNTPESRKVGETYFNRTLSSAPIIQIFQAPEHTSHCAVIADLALRLSIHSGQDLRAGHGNRCEDDERSAGMPTEPHVVGSRRFSRGDYGCEAALLLEFSHFRDIIMCRCRMTK